MKIFGGFYFCKYKIQALLYRSLKTKYVKYCYKVSNSV